MAPSIPSSIVEIKKDFSFKELPKDYYTPSKCPDSCSKAPADAEDGRIEGGAHAWLTVIGSCLIYFACFGIINSFGFFQTYYQKDFLKDVSASTISFIGTIQILLLNVLAAPAGSIFDAYGLKALYIFSGITCTLGLLGLSFIPVGSLWQTFLLHGVCIGFAVGSGTQPALVVAGQHFVKRRALILGIVSAAGSAGGVCFPVIFSQLERTHGVGFQWSLRVVAAISGLCYTLAILISHTKMPKAPLRSITNLVDFRGFRDLKYSVLAIGTFSAMLGQFIPSYYINTYLEATHPTSPAKLYLLPLFNATGFLGRILGGLTADPTGPLNTTYPSLLLSGLICLLPWSISSSLPSLDIFAIVYGFSSGVFIAVLPVCVAQMTTEGECSNQKAGEGMDVRPEGEVGDSRPDEEQGCTRQAPEITKEERVERERVGEAKLGVRIGAFYSVCSVAQLVGSPIGGALIGETSLARGGGGGSAFRGLIVFAGLTSLVGGLIVFVVRLTYGRNLLVRH